VGWAFEHRIVDGIGYSELGFILGLQRWGSTRKQGL
jgi:hypothetical protein